MEDTQGNPETPRRRNWLRILAGLLLVVCAVDALAFLFHAATGASPLSVRASEIAAALVSAAVYAMMFVTPRLPKRILLPPILVCIWSWSGPVPLQLLGWRQVDLLAAGLRLAVTALVFLHLRIRGGSWLPSAPLFDGPAFHLGRTFRFALLSVLLAAVYVVAYLPSALARMAERQHAGFLAFEGGCVWLEERVYVRDDRTIRLVAMLHFADPSFYSRLQETFAGIGSVVLSEGIRDCRGVSPDVGMARLAARAGLAAQEPMREVDARWPHVVNADIELCNLDENTAALYRRKSELDPAEYQRISAEVMEIRNRHLLERIEAALASYRVLVVPWGTAHMAWLEERILALGFKHEDTVKRCAAPYAMLVKGLLRSLRGEVAASDDFAVPPAPAAKVPEPEEVVRRFGGPDAASLAPHSIAYQIDLDRLAPLGDGAANAARWFGKFSKEGPWYGAWRELKQEQTATARIAGTERHVLPGDHALLRAAEGWADQATCHFYPEVFPLRGAYTAMPELVLLNILGNSWLARGLARESREESLADARRAVRLGRLMLQNGFNVYQDLIAIQLIGRGAAVISEIAALHGDEELATLGRLVAAESSVLRGILEEWQTPDLGDGVLADGSGYRFTLSDEEVRRAAEAAVSGPARSIRIQAAWSLWKARSLGSPGQRAVAEEALCAALTDADSLVRANAEWCMAPFRPEMYADVWEKVAPGPVPATSSGSP